MPRSPSTPLKHAKKDAKLVTSPFFERKPPSKKRKSNLLPVALDVKDPLILFNARKRAQLLHKLSTLRPVLIQEQLARDPWKLLIAVMLLNLTSGKLATPIFWKLIDQYPTPQLLSAAIPTDLAALLQPLGLNVIRAKRLIALSLAYMEHPPSYSLLYQSNVTMLESKPPDDSIKPSRGSSSHSRGRRRKYPPTSVSHLPGTGPYALDSYRIFCLTTVEPDAWKEVMAMDKELIKYLRWKWALEEEKNWTPGFGVTGDISLEDLGRLVEDLEEGALMR